MGTRWVTHDNGIAWEASQLLSAAGLCHGVTGRGGGVSIAPCDSLNLALHVGDDVTAVLENRRRLCAMVGWELPRMTTAQQTHEDHVVAVGEAECGSGAGSYEDALAHTDALMTNQKQIPLVIFVADCVPVILFDPLKQVCAVVHDGWRGTVARLAAKTVFAMTVAYGCRPSDILAYIGPSISAAHFEVSEATAGQFRRMSPAYADCVRETKNILTVDLWQANRQLLIDAGLAEKHIDLTESCVYEDRERFFSYRRDCSHTGRMAAFVMLT
jgi:YfiH family protein